MFRMLLEKKCFRCAKAFYTCGESFVGSWKKKTFEREELMLEWGSNPQDPQIEKDVLNNLQPSTNLKKLNIKYYGGTSFPNWIGHSSFSNIIVLNVSQ